MNKTTLCIYT